MKGFANFAALSVLVGSALAAPARILPRQINANGTTAGGLTDVDILQFALSLEYLEINLYETVVNAYSDAGFQSAGYKAADRDTFLQIIDQELEHIANLRSTVRMMGATPVSPCKYSYGSPSTLGQWLNVTDAVNGLGPSAYLGAGAFISDKLVLTTGSSIGIVEARHNSWLNGLIGRSELPTTFQLALTPTQSYGVASQFIVAGSCSGTLNAVEAYPPVITITNKGYPEAPLTNGATVYVGGASDLDAPRAAFLTGFNTTIVDFDSSTQSAVIPADVKGQSYIVLTTATQGQTLTNANSLSAPQALFVDAPAQSYSGLEFSTYQFSK